MRANWERVSLFEPYVSGICLSPLLWAGFLFVVVAILFLLAAQQNQHHTSAHYPPGLGSRGTR